MIDKEFRVGIHILTENPDYMLGRVDHILEGLYDRPTHSRQWKVSFENGYGASIITGSGAFCDYQHPYELGLLHNDTLCEVPDCMEGDMVYGYLDLLKLEQLLDTICQLPPNPTCTHKRSYDAASS